MDRLAVAFGAEVLFKSWINLAEHIKMYEFCVRCQQEPSKSDSSLPQMSCFDLYYYYLFIIIFEIFSKNVKKMKKWKKDTQHYSRRRIDRDWCSPFVRLKSNGRQSPAYHFTVWGEKRNITRPHSYQTSIYMVKKIYIYICATNPNSSKERKKG